MLNPGELDDIREEFIGPLLRGAYFKVVPHPNSAEPTSLILPLAANPAAPAAGNYKPQDVPWAPFRSRADFGVAEIIVKGGLDSDLSKKLTEGASDGWNEGRSRVTIQSVGEMQRTLEAARQYGVRFKSASVSASYKGVEHEIKFEYRDPWDWVLALLNDETLGPLFIYNSAKKFYCEGSTVVDHEERVIDEPNTAETWAKYESELPPTDRRNGRKPRLFHCLLPLHFWLDEGLVTKHVTMHPFVFRPVFLPSHIRNASGNGGGILGGYMPPVMIF
ncbi:hypothetical protein R3P38DRAFT_2590004 [Favolaschia claudopus]|uniref:Uncharacterized protein n=1 Tax=Favolaschia claudopus TaxID=2862362 RepID=A0AAV9Z107_9AGAR